MTDYYIDPDEGTSGGAGTRADPLDTAPGSLSASDRLLFKPGTATVLTGTIGTRDDVHLKSWTDGERASIRFEGIPDAQCIGVFSRDNVVIRDLNISCDNEVNGISSNNDCVNLTIQDCDFRGMEIPINVTRVTTLLISGVNILRCQNHGITITGNGTGTVTSTGVVVRDVRVEDHGQGSPTGNYDGIFIGDGVTNFLVEDCTVEVTKSGTVSTEMAHFDFSGAPGSVSTGTVRRCFAINGHNGFAVSSSTAAADCNVTFEYCVGVKHDRAPFEMHNNGTMTLRNCTGITPESSVGGRPVHLDNIGTKVFTMDGSLMSAGSTQDYVMYYTTSGTTIAGNNNYFFGGQEGFARYGVGPLAYDLAAFATATTSNAASEVLSEDPFVDDESSGELNQSAGDVPRWWTEGDARPVGLNAEPFPDFGISAGANPYVGAAMHPSQL